MSRAESTIVKSFAVAIATFALAAQAAPAQQDLRSPDRQQPVAAAPQDLRSPDARDVAAVPPSPTRTFRDLVSPDARDSARDIVRVPVATGAVAADRGFQWDDAGVGGALVAALLGAGIAGATMRRRHHRPGRPAVI